MKYMLLIIGSLTNTDGEEEPVGEAFMQWEKDLLDAGVKVDGHVLEGPELGTSVRVRDGERMITDGPYAETREFVGGLCTIDVPDLDAALEWAARCPGSRYGRVEVRPIWEWDGA